MTAAWDFFAAIPPWIVGHWPLPVVIALGIATLGTLAAVKERT